MWRRSWKRTCLHSACSSIFDRLLRQAEGSLGESSLTGDGNSHRLADCSLYIFSIARTGFESRIVLTEEGLALEHQLKEIAGETEEILLRGMTAEEQAQLNHLLQMALDNMNACRASFQEEAGEELPGK